ncbi:hypothetical protein MKW92_029129 [Papaver armeniacum]|nr:hypothetical protein MKW92_029129 [Papaver armeniacum]
MVNNNEQPAPATSSSEGTCYFSPFSSFWTFTSLISTVRLVVFILFVSIRLGSNKLHLSLV